MMLHMINWGKPHHWLHLSKSNVSLKLVLKSLWTFLNTVTGKLCYWNVQGTRHSRGARDVQYNQSRKPLLKNTCRAAHGVLLGTMWIVQGDKLSVCNLWNCNLRRRGRVVKYYKVNGTFSISNKKNPLISINTSQ